MYGKEYVDLETLDLDDVFKVLKCDENGLSSSESKRRLEIFGSNKLKNEKQKAFLQVCSSSLLLNFATL